MMKKMRSFLTAILIEQYFHHIVKCKKYIFVFPSNPLFFSIGRNGRKVGAKWLILDEMGRPLRPNLGSLGSFLSDEVTRDRFRYLIHLLLFCKKI